MRKKKKMKEIQGVNEEHAYNKLNKDELIAEFNAAVPERDFGNYHSTLRTTILCILAKRGLEEPLSLLYGKFYS